MSLFGELKRRNVFRVGAAYLVASWLIIQVSETIFPLFGLEAAARIVVVVLAVGFVPALVFAWAFELTPEGLKMERDVDRSASITPQTGRKLDRLIMAVLALALGYFALDKFVFEPQREAALQQEKAAAVEQARHEGRSEALVKSYGDKSIAVLPFVDMSSGKDQEYLSDGIAEELLNLLAKIPNLRVISRSSAFSFKGKELAIPEIARRLNVAHILEGSVRKAGNQVRITAQLIQARSDTHLWSETYDRRLDDIFAIQDEIAGKVVEQLKVTLLGEPPKVTHTNPEAYALFLQARYLGQQGSAESYEKSNVLYEQALAVDPGYAAAWADMARNCVNQIVKGLRPIAEGYAAAREMLQKALALDPNHAPAHSRLGWIAMFYDNDLAGAARHMERALALEPTNIDIISNASTMLLILGRLDEGIALQQYVVAHDPVSPVRYSNLGWFHRMAGHWEQAIAAKRTELQLSPDALGAHFDIGVALLFLGEAEAALEEMRQEPSEPYRLSGLAMAHHALGQAAESDAALEQLLAKYETEWTASIAAVLAYRNEPDRTFEWLAKAVEYRSDALAYVPISSLYTNVHADPRWLPFLESIGKSPQQLAAIKFEVKLPQ